MAVENFRTYLKNKYSPEVLKKRFGFSDVTYVEPPMRDAPMSTINDPLFQEWTDFRCQQLADFYGIMGRYVRELNSEVAVVNNPHRGLSGRNTMWEQGVDYPRLLSHTDIVWTEEGNGATVNDEGVLIFNNVFDNVLAFLFRVIHCNSVLSVYELICPVQALVNFLKIKNLLTELLIN